MTETIDFVTAGPVASNWDVSWIHGTPRKRASDEPPIQTHRHDRHTVVMRQSKTISYEAPFLYLLFGNDRALLIDTGAGKDPGAFPLRQTVDALISEWLEDNPRTDYRLIVAHSHGHLDHVAHDDQFADRADTVVVGRPVEDVHDFFNLAQDGGHEPVPFDLGGRVLQVLAIPGHHAASIAIYDPWTGWLLTGDTVYPGRLYVSDFPAFVDSLDRLVGFTAEHTVSHVLGCHIEMTTSAGRDYPIGSTYQPHEPPLAMTVEQLVRVRDAAHEVAARPGVHRYDDFIIFHGRCTTEVLRQIARSLARSVKGLVAPGSLK